MGDDWEIYCDENPRECGRLLASREYHPSEDKADEEENDGDRRMLQSHRVKAINAIEDLFNVLDIDHDGRLERSDIMTLNSRLDAVVMDYQPIDYNNFNDVFVGENALWINLKEFASLFSKKLFNNDQN